ncbi:MAG TPA: prepilin peptidase [Isosphaeraceae bacterium]|nr:prepilin peptidase [Isosphaeraceae bacterium]
MTAWHHAILAILFLVVGSCVGSFVNVCAYRIPRGLSLCHPRSRCPRCRRFIRARDNLPVLGWLILRGRCRSCRGAIAPRYAAVELAVGLAFAGTYVAAAGLAGGDVWERAGVRVVFAGLLATWTTISLGLVAALIAYDRGCGLTGPGAPAQHRGAGRGADLA